MLTSRLVVVVRFATARAVEVAYRPQGDYPGGVFWVNAAEDWQTELARRAEDVGLREDKAQEADRP